MGLRAGIAVAVANVDAHVSAPAAAVTAPGRWSRSWARGSATSSPRREAHGRCRVCAASSDGVIPGLYGFEAGQPALGDLFAWFVERAVPAAVSRGGRAGPRAATVHEALDRGGGAASARRIHGLLAFDWWNGNRSVLVDADLTGVLIGMTLVTEAPSLR